MIDYTEQKHMERSKKISLWMAIIIGVVVAYFFAYLLANNAAGDANGITAVLRNLSAGKIFFMPSFRSLFGVILGLVVGLAIYFLNYMDTTKREHYKDDAVAGTGRFISDEELAAYTNKYIQKDPPVIEDNLPVAYDPEHDKEMYSQSIIMSQNYFRPVDPRAIQGTNNNCMVVGAPGSGKSRFVVKPNILQMNASYVITDPSGEAVHSLGSVLRDHGYKIKIFNLADMEHSNHYNPLAYVKNETEVQTLIECFVNNTQKGGGGGDNQFFVDAEKLLYSACIYYLTQYEKNVERINFTGIVKMVNASNIDEGNANAKSPLDDLFDKLPKNSLAWETYKSFKQGAGKTLKSIIISCLVRLRPFMVPQVEKLTGTDDLELDKIGTEKTALFIITPQGNDAYSFLASMLYSQLFETLYAIGDKNERETGDPSMPIHVRCILDEFKNIGEIPQFPAKLSTMRKYNISATIILQDISQIEAMYKEEWRTMIGDCSTCIFLGSNEQNTLKYFSEQLGKMTVRTKSDNISHGTKGGSEGYQNTGREVMTADELRRLPTDECIVFPQNMRPIKDKKYDYEKHPYFKQTADFNEDNAFNYAVLAAYNTSFNSDESLMKARSEAARYWDTLYDEKSTFTNLNNMKVEIEGSPADAISFGSKEDEMARRQWIENGTLAALEQTGPICIIVMKWIPVKDFPDIVSQISVRAKKPNILIFDDITVGDDDVYITGLALDKTGIGMKEIMQTEFTKELEEAGDYLIIKISKHQINEFKEAMLIRAGALEKI